MSKYRIIKTSDEMYRPQKRVLWLFWCDCLDRYCEGYGRYEYLHLMDAEKHINSLIEEARLKKISPIVIKEY